MILSSIPSAVAQIFQTIAFQNERSGLITLIGYVGLVYAFLADAFVFKYVFAFN